MIPDDFLAQSINAKAKAAVGWGVAAGAGLASAASRHQNTALAEQRDRLRAALGNPPQIAALQEMLANELPSYFPGIDFAQTAYHEGRKAVLRELLQFLTIPENA
jgi:hypothetical protein